MYAASKISFTFKEQVNSTIIKLSKVMLKA